MGRQALKRHRLRLATQIGRQGSWVGAAHGRPQGGRREILIRLVWLQASHCLVR